MLTHVTEDVHVHQSECILSNSVIVEGDSGVLLIDAGLTTDEMAGLADDLAARGTPVLAGFSTHPDWDHVLWHPRFGAGPRWGTAACAASLADLLSHDDWQEQIAEGLPPEIADDVPTALLGQVSALPVGAARVPWNGPEIRIIEHQGHAPGHAALLIVDAGVLVAGDMLSDVLVPMLDLQGPADPVVSYLRALDLFDEVIDDVRFVIPGHGNVGGAGEARARIHLDRAYVRSLSDGAEVGDPRIGSSARPGWEWVGDVHAGQAAGLAERRTRERFTG